jgi:hypothetical protein
MLGRSTSARRQKRGENPRVTCQWRFLLLEESTSDLNSELTSNSNTTLLCIHIPRTPLISLRAIFSLSTTEKKS